VHLADHLEHAIKLRVLSVDHHVDAVAEDVEVRIGDQRSHFD
jgi:hypothetical protein